jgi:hypothetical protein
MLYELMTVHHNIIPVLYWNTQFLVIPQKSAADPKLALRMTARDGVILSASFGSAVQAPSKAASRGRLLGHHQPISQAKHSCRDAMHCIPTGQFPRHNWILSILNASLPPQVARLQLTTDKFPSRQNGVTSFTVASCRVLSGVRI